MTRSVLAIFVLLCLAAPLTSCLSRTEEGDAMVYPGSLTAGSMSLQEYPVEKTGISGLGPYCRRVFECGCPLLQPDDVAACRAEVWEYSEELCETLIFSQLPECQS